MTKITIWGKSYDTKTWSVMERKYLKARISVNLKQCDEEMVKLIDKQLNLLDSKKYNDILKFKESLENIYKLC